LFASTVTEKCGELIVVAAGKSATLVKRSPDLGKMEFNGNLDLVCGLAEHLGIGQNVVLNGIRKAKQDIGKLFVWKFTRRETRKTCFVVNGFAANDPESTLQVFRKVQELLPSASEKLVGLMSLRADRADRTEQWIKALLGDEFEFMKNIWVTGGHARIVARKVKNARVLKGNHPKEMMESILAETEDQQVIVGFGNMKGTGELLVDYWSREGEAHEL
jgi:hypothetical protein